MLRTPRAVLAGIVCGFAVVGLIVGLVLVSRQNPDATANQIGAVAGDHNQKAEPQESDAETAPPQPQALSPAQVFEQASASVASLIARDEFGKPVAQGSGFVIPSSNGTSDAKEPRVFIRVLTNYHVISAAADLEIEFPGGHRFTASQVEAESESEDLAIVFCISSDFLSKGVSPPNDVGKPLIVSTALPSVGSKVFAIGSPQGLSNSLSEGLVGAHRTVRDGVTLIQTSTPVSPGSSGGPLLNEFGDVVGVVTASHHQGQNLNFAVSCENVQEFLRTAAAMRKTAGRSVWKGRSIKDECESAYSAVTKQIDFQKIVNGSSEDPHQRALLRFTRAIRRGDEADAATAIRELEESSAERLEWLREFLLGIVALKRHSADIIGNSPDSPVGAPLSGLMTDGGYVGGGAIARGVNMERARDHFQACVQRNRSFEPGLFYLALTQAATGRLTEALATTTELTVQMPNSGRVWYVRGMIFSFLNQQPAARRDLERAHELMPSNANVCEELGTICRFLKEFDTALTWHSKAMALADEYIKFMQKLRMAEVLHDMGDVERAMAMLTHLIHQPDDCILECRMSVAMGVAG